MQNFVWSDTGISFCEAKGKAVAFGDNSAKIRELFEVGEGGGSGEGEEFRAEAGEHGRIG